MYNSRVLFAIIIYLIRNSLRKVKHNTYVTTRPQFLSPQYSLLCSKAVSEIVCSEGQISDYGDVRPCFNFRPKRDYGRGRVSIGKASEKIA